MIPPGKGSPITRREAIRKTVVFSTALMTAGWLSRLQAQLPSSQFPSGGIHLLAFGDYGSKNEVQAAIARQMAAFAGTLGQPLTAVLALGDSFYGKFTADRFQKHFEEMYAAEKLNCPFYFCLGNHDYEPVSYGLDPEPLKGEMELAYARENPSSRWKMPAKWYALELPDATRPLVKIIVLDSNIQEGALTPQEKLAQDRFFVAELAKPRTAPWLWVAAHHPVYSDSKSRGDNPQLIKRWADYFKNNPVSLYLAGHDHTLQHLEVEGSHTSFVVSGAGGQDLHDLKFSNRGFTEKIHGFNHIHLTAERMVIQYIDIDGNRLHAFQRTPAGSVEVLS